MKAMLRNSILPAVMLMPLLSSCVVEERHGREVATVGVGFGYYDTLPVAYDDPYYYYGNRYYYGGIWEPGRFLFEGRYYDGRYRHGGHVYYGGRYDGGHHHSSRRHHDHH